MVSRVCVVLLAAFPGASGNRESGVLELISQAKNFRDGALEVLTEIAQAPAVAKKSSKVASFSDRWLTVWSLSEGIPGLVRDFLMNFFGREEYHNKNDKLINAINRAEYVATAQEQVDDQERRLRDEPREIMKEGKLLFKSGTLYSMLDEMDGILADKELGRLLVRKLLRNKAMHGTFSWLRG